MVESVVWQLSNGSAKIRFVSMVDSIAGELNFPLPLEDAEIGISDNKSLLKFLSIMKDDIQVSLIKEHGIFLKIHVTDDVYEGTFSLADVNRIEEAPMIEEPKTFELSFPLDKAFKEQYLKAYKALDNISRVTVQTTKKDIKITLGNKESYANKISFNMPCSDFLPLDKPKTFSGNAIAKILANNINFFYGLVEVSQEGLMKICIKDDISTITYYLIELEEL